MKIKNNTEKLLLNHYQNYPALQIEDIFKFSYQSAYGCEHMVSDLNTAILKIKEEAKTIRNKSEKLIENLDGEYSRIDLSYLNYGLSAETLGKIFFLSSNEAKNGKTKLEKMLFVARQLICEDKLPFDIKRYDNDVEIWKNKDFPSIHHSSTYKHEYSPSYRVISNKFVPFIPLFSKIDTLLSNRDAIIAIDGNSAGGKSTLGEMLKDIYNCNLFHIDDFFLQPHQRTKERLNEIGGNFDRERFIEEILKPLSEKKKVNYRRFDCNTLSLLQPKTILPNKLTVIEGVYSTHPALSKYYDFSVFIEISKEIQTKRITRRNSQSIAQMFFDKWIPLENIYFDKLNIKEKCDMIIKTE